MAQRIEKQTILNKFQNKIIGNESLLMFGAGTEGKMAKKGV